MSKHTEGNWQTHDDEHCPEEIWGNLEGPLEDGQVHGTLVCTINTECAEWPANAALILAAPELLSCLLAYVELEESSAPYSSSPMRNRARAAINKANR